MKKILLFLSCIISVQLEAISIKDKIVNLRKALAVHAQSETKTWDLLEELDQRLARIEARIKAHTSRPRASVVPSQPLPQALPQAHSRQEEQGMHNAHHCRHAYTHTAQQADSPEEETSYFQRKAAYFNSLLNTLRNHIENGLPKSQQSLHSANTLKNETYEPINVRLKKRRSTHSPDTPRRLQRFKRHSMPIEEIQPVQPRAHRPSCTCPTHY